MIRVAFGLAEKANQRYDPSVTIYNDLYKQIKHI